ncbi:MAG: hypothetical protein NT039_04650 [Candidatus Berkelbacteria bacterium]|nr:hypothetical protein [Candidatus Berkelbacteria bacterium]
MDKTEDEMAKKMGISEEEHQEWHRKHKMASMKKGWCFAIVPGVIIFVIAVFLVALLLIKLVWAWTIPDLFPGAVAQGLVAGSISWYTALKLAIFLAVMAGIAGARREHHYSRRYWK